MADVPDGRSEMVGRVLDGEGRHVTNGRLTLALTGAVTALYFLGMAWLTNAPILWPLCRCPLCAYGTAIMLLPVGVAAGALVALVARRSGREELAARATRAWVWAGRAFLAAFVTLGLAIAAKSVGTGPEILGCLDDGGPGDAGGGLVADGYVLFYPVLVLLSMVCLPSGMATSFVFCALFLMFPAGLLGKTDTLEAVQQTYFFAMFNLVQLYPMSWVLNRAWRLDQVQTRNVRSKAALAAEKGVTLATRRTEDFVHDEVLSALLVVARGELGIGPIKKLLAGLRTKLTQRVVPSSPANWQEFYAQLQEEMQQWAGFVSVVGTVEKSQPIPGAVSGALLAAIREAVRNSLAHAGVPDREVRREVRVEGTDRRLRIEVWDNGVGLPADGAEGRHGMKNSILRCAEDTGVQVAVRSAPGRGTQVVFELGYDEELPEPFGMVMGSPWLRVIIAALVGYNALATVLHWRSYSLPGVSLAVGVMMSVAAVLLLVPQGPRARAVVTNAAIVALIWASTAAQSFTTLGDTPLYWAHWASSVGGLILCGVLALEMTALAWLGMGGIVSIWAAATAFHGFDWGELVEFMSGHGFLLLIWQVVVLWVDHSARRISFEDHHRAELVYWLQVEGVVQTHLVATRERLRLRIIPLLDRVAASDELTLRDRLEARLLEAELRDEIRAACFTGTEALVAVRRLRVRGVEVVLLDDTGGQLSETERDQVAAEVNRALALLDPTKGIRQVVVRVPPVSRDRMAQVVVDGEQVLSLVRAAN
ncbi:MAG: ATP-binding protein [Buchananella hordeovulneris]|nr:ATP-binding protein [Buchananella hordeovulneris]